MESNSDQMLAPQSDACASSAKTNSLVGVGVATVDETGQAVAGAERLDESTQVDGWNVA
jgi:hypothetical protein